MQHDPCIVTDDIYLIMFCRLATGHDHPIIIPALRPYDKLAGALLISPAASSQGRLALLGEAE